MCKVWGFLKYFHPIVALGKLDWDGILREEIAKTAVAATREDMRRIFDDLIAKYEEIMDRTDAGRLIG